MSILDETQFVERLQFFNGERLFAEDLQGIDDFNREMRRLHNRSLHQPGIGSGFGVEGEKGDRQVTIAPGYALDNLGREIVLTHQQVLPIPPVAGGGSGNSAFYELSVAYPEDSALKPAETRQVICGAGQAGTIRLKEEPVFCWIRLSGDQGQATTRKSKEDLHNHVKIPLAQIEVFNCQLKQRISVVRRCNARPDCGPHICCGRLPLYECELEEKESVKSETRELGYGFPILHFRTRISTARAQFLTVPSYTVQMQGERLGSGELGEFVLGSRQFVEDAQIGHLTVASTILLFGLLRRQWPRSTASLVDHVKAHIRANWFLVWLGIEL